MDPIKIKKADYVNALKDMNTYLDISVDDLMSIEKKARQHAIFRLTTSIAVKEFMTHPVITVAPDASIANAAELMLQKHIAGMPVVDANNKLLGIFTETDLLTAVGIPRNQPAQSVWSRLETIFSRPPQLDNFYSTVSELMIKNVVTVQPDETLGDVLSKMKKASINRVVVTDEQQVVGIVTRSNLVRLFLEHLAQQEPIAD
jgi:CBS-domain-containing membrane protein